MNPHVAQAYDAMLRRVRSGLYRPGDRFMSNRAVATHFGVSYQTAHRLLSRLVEEGLLLRSDRSGTYLPGDADRPTSVRLVLHPRAAVAGSFGAKLMASLREAMRAAHIGCDVTHRDDAPLPRHRLPVLWESPEALRRSLQERRRAILVHERPPPSLEAATIDSVAIDDFAGGVMAAQYLQRTLGGDGRLAVLGGPPRDRRSRERIAGFVSEARAKVIHAHHWFTPAGQAAAPRVLAQKPAAVFCCNDRLAQGLVLACAAAGVAPLRIIGFDDAPVAEQLGLSTVAIPWEAMAAAVARLARARLGGSDDPATHLLLYPRLVLRGGGGA